MRLMLKILTLFVTVLVSNFVGYSFDTAPNIDSMYHRANAVINSKSSILEIVSVDKMVLKTKKRITVLNEKGLEAIDANVYYDKSIAIKELEVKIFNLGGKEIKRIKKSDFKDYSATGSSFLTDDRVLVFDYNPVSYPIVIEFVSEIVRKNTAFLPRWHPITNFNVSIIKDEFEIHNYSGIELKHKTFNFKNYGGVNFTKKENVMKFSLENFKAIDAEVLMPSFEKIVPKAFFSLEKFNLEGVEGTTENWSEFGKWMYESLLKDVLELPEATKEKIHSLVQKEPNPIRKARIVYDYVQNSTRYISVQLGIGGWKPMEAKEVAKLGYGDCKALSNYTKALLNEVGVPSFYTIINAGSEKEDFIEDFVSMQGNHAILTIPNGQENIFLECTSQTDPFSYQGKFTDDRLALIVNENGGKIVRTNNYGSEKNKQEITGKIVINEDCSLFASSEIKSTGIQYDVFRKIVDVSDSDKENYYKEHYSYINNLVVNKSEVANDKDKIQIIENIELEAKNYASLYGNDMVFPVNVFNRDNYVPKRMSIRKFPFEIERGYFDTDSLDVFIPDNYSLDSLPENFIEVNKFGEYSIVFKKINESQLRFIRTLLIKPGYYSKDEYEAFRIFKEIIAKNDNVKILIHKK
ncbi:DUF3857 domain-containing protein [Flavobacterium chuncheonense]|uniref:DUF3857 domain-containing protein n=1 Tax=Flavobacterium chuncheonense TaxID=2026653 RepID=A0ABW5YLP7_9FLAO